MLNPPFFTSIDQFNRAGFREQSAYTFRTGAVAAGYEYEVGKRISQHSLWASMRAAIIKRDSSTRAGSLFLASR